MPKIIKLVGGSPHIVDDLWGVIRDVELLDEINLSNKIVPLSYFHTAGIRADTSKCRAVWISPDDDFEPLAPHLRQLDLIAVDFPSFRDGRGYSIATLLRSRYRWTGELRAIGDVLRDQLNYMRRCGFDSFAVRADKDIHDALLSFNHYSVKYQGSVDEPLPLFRRRSGNHG
ncbi:DUF934 domain-containing protein [Noviherbaspirillum autotrophicum]|uniref:Oxidoreductase n=1 Tax=Noviherbaspirillum autotrophicum TaxID=709839 RepID=A0A0C2BS99_9BURK|nr:DUF934 domain-containing protein [Noviherbaspirillum autotrophicum]KIF81643.1 hypothetical protein TSA66_13935 [Noviherbaspirillum autotrophicum]KIF82004.1 hypothetical protein TSA66_16270 [Noviherbaspirillum autotrophicum]KIF84110.1 hypothetical protein TSA66_00765 [Noviherbaspirillum autotrophicum]